MGSEMCIRDRPSSSTPVDEAMLAFREKTQQVVQVCMDKELAGSTEKSYDDILRLEVAHASKATGIEFLRMVTEEQFTALFSAVLVAHESHVKWSRIRALKAALVHWHKRRHTRCILDCWTAEMVAFWRGFSKQCSHDSCGKDPWF